MVYRPPGSGLTFCPLILDGLIEGISGTQSSKIYVLESYIGCEHGRLTAMALGNERLHMANGSLAL